VKNTKNPILGQDVFPDQIEYVLTGQANKEIEIQVQHEKTIHD
jgi:hypothetical protein